MVNFDVIEYKNERIPVIPEPGHEDDCEGDLPLISCDGRQWSINEDGMLVVDGVTLTTDEVSVSPPGPQDDPLFQALTDFDELGDFPPLSYPIPGEESVRDQTRAE